MTRKNSTAFLKPNQPQVAQIAARGCSFHRAYPLLTFAGLIWAGPTNSKARWALLDSGDDKVREAPCWVTHRQPTEDLNPNDRPPSNLSNAHQSTASVPPWARTPRHVPLSLSIRPDVPCGCRVSSSVPPSRDTQLPWLARCQEPKKRAIHGVGSHPNELWGRGLATERSTKTPHMPRLRYRPSQAGGALGTHSSARRPRDRWDG